MYYTTIMFNIMGLVVDQKQLNQETKNKLIQGLKLLLTKLT